jgi:hypothetical protein
MQWKVLAGGLPIWMIDIAALRCHYPMALILYRKSGGLGSASECLGCVEMICDTGLVRLARVSTGA